VAAAGAAAPLGVSVAGVAGISTGSVAPSSGAAAVFAQINQAAVSAAANAPPAAGAGDVGQPVTAQAVVGTVGMGSLGVVLGTALANSQGSSVALGGAPIPPLVPAGAVWFHCAAPAVAVGSPLDILVSPAQRLIIAALPALEARALVQAPQVPLHALDSDNVVQCKLVLAAWAADATRPAEDFRALPTAVRTAALGHLCVDAALAEPLQDAFLPSADGIFFPSFLNFLTFLTFFSLFRTLVTLPRAHLRPPDVYYS
jgi:hypothetical protein